MVEKQVFEISFIVESKEIKPDQITAHLNIVPTRERNIREWPNVIHHMSNLPEDLKPRNVWEFSAKVETETGINDSLVSFSETLYNAELEIKQLCSSFSTKPCLIITLNAEHLWEKQDLTIPIRLLLLMHDISAEIIIALR